MTVSRVGRWIIGLIVVPALAGLAGLASAQPLFGPRDFTQSTAAPQTSYATFLRPGSAAPPFFLHLENGPDGSPRLRHATITLNGREIVDSHDLGPHVSVVDKPVSLLPVNLLAVTLAGPIHGTLRITIEGRGASLTDVTPASGRQGETVTIQVVGENTHFVQGSTKLWAGPGVSVGGAPAGEFGPVTVQDPTHLSATLTLGATTVLGPRTLVAKTNGERAALHQGFTVLAGTPAIAGTTVTTLAGTGEPGLTDGSGASAEFRFPADVAGRPEGGGVVADTANNKLRQVSPDGTVSTTPLSVSLLLPAGVTIDPSGRTIIADTAHCVIRIVNADNTVTTIGRPWECDFADGPAGTARFRFPRDVVADSAGNLYVADTGSFRVRKIDPQGNVSTLAGSGHFGDTDGPPATATFGLLAGIAVRDDGTVIVSDAVFHRLRQIRDGIVTPLAGTGTPGFADGPTSSAQFVFPTGLARDESGNLYITDTKNNLIRRLTSQGMVETIAGTGARGHQDGPGTEATFDRPLGLSPATAGQLLVADTFNHLIRRIQVIPPPTITGLNPSLGVQGETLTLKVSGTNLTGATALTFLRGGTPDSAITAKDLTVNAEGTELTATVTIDLIAALGSRVVTVTTPGGTSDPTPSPANTFTVLGQITLVPNFVSLAEGETGGLTVQLSAPAPAGGHTVSLTSAAPGVATVPASLAIPAGATSAPTTVTALLEGTTNLTATAPGFADGLAIVTVRVRVPTVSSFNPTSGVVGTTVILTGTGFRPTPSLNSVSFSGPNDTRVGAAVTVATATSLKVAVPPEAVTGRLQVVTSGGTAMSVGHFVVLPTQDFQLTALPNTIGVPAAGQGAISLSLSGSGGFTGLTTVAVSGVPSGVTATFGSPTLTAGQSALLTLRTFGVTLAGSYPLIISATGLLDGVQTSRAANLILQIQPPGQTSLTGQVLGEDAKPVKGAVVKLGSLQVSTDDAGNFLLLDPPIGPDQLLFIDGTPASTPERSYPIIPYKVSIVAGQANTLGFTPHLHLQKTTGLVDISNSSIQRVVTDPAVPGFEMRIPAGVTITGWDGQPNAQVSIRKVPIDRNPLPPVPGDLYAPSLYMDYFGKQGGGTPSQPVPITFPNDLDVPPGTPVELWFYDEAPDGSRPNQWARYGTGTVSPDGSQIVPDINPATGQPYGQPRFCCGAALAARNRALQEAVNAQRAGERTAAEGAGARGGEPVDLATGIFLLEKTDLVLPGRLPIVFSRTYRTKGPTAGPFGPGTSHSYQSFLLIEGNLRTLVLPDGGRIPFPKQPDGTFRTLTGARFRGAVLTEAAATHTLRFKDGATWTFGAAAFGMAFLIAQTDRNGNTITLTRSGTLGQLDAITEPTGRQLVLTNEPVGLTSRITALTDPLGRTVRYSYDASGRLETVTDPAGGVTRYSYDEAGRMRTITDPRGITFLTTDYDSDGRVSRQTQADGGTWTFAYTVTGGVVTQTVVTDPRGNATTHRFNGQGFPLSVTDALGQTTTFTRDSATNQLLATTDPLGRVTQLSYDASGNVTSITDPLGHIRSFTYDPTFNRVTSITDPLGNVTHFEYDPINGDLLNITDPLGNATQIAYNQFGQPISTTDAVGNISTFTYTSQGDLASVTDPLGNTTQRTYDLVSRLIAQTDPRGQTTRFSYDNLNRLSQIIDALNGLTTVGYDPNGNLLTVTDARGNTITHEYDTMDRLGRRIDQLGAAESFNYDGNGNLVSTTDRKGQTTTFSYDALNRRTQSSYADGAATTFSYDAAGRLVQADDTGDPHRPINLTYDALDRLLAETTALGTVSYQYDQLGRRRQMTVGGQAPVDYTYDANSRLRTIAQSSIPSPVTIDYDALGRRTLLTLPNGVSTEYVYDPSSRLSALIYRNALGSLGDLTYQYDQSGNRIGVGGSFARTLLPDSVPSATYDAANRQLAFGNKNMSFDNNGNLTTLTDATGSSTFTWDARNRLRTLRDAIVNNFAYDALGRRVLQTPDGRLVEYQFDRREVVRTRENERENSYVRTLEMDEVVYRMQPNGLAYYLADVLRGTVALIDESDNPATTYAYEPFGVTLVTGTPSDNPFQFTGRENDGRLYYYRARYYLAATSRFISEDPLGRALPIDHSYGYVSGNPLGFIDPLGLIKFSTFGGASLRAVFPYVGGETNLGFRAGTESGGERGAIQTYFSARLFPGTGAAIGRGAFVGAAFRDVSELSRLNDVTIDTPAGSISILFDGRGLAGIQIGGPTPLLAIAVGGPLFDYWSVEKILWGDEILPVQFPNQVQPLRTGNPQTGNPTLRVRK